MCLLFSGSKRISLLKEEIRLAKPRLVEMCRLCWWWHILIWRACSHSGLVADTALLVLSFQLHNSFLPSGKINAWSIIPFVFLTMIAVILASQDLAFDICGKYEYSNCILCYCYLYEWQRWVIGVHSDILCKIRLCSVYGVSSVSKYWDNGAIETSSHHT